MWSFRLKQVVRLEGPCFTKFYPFRNQEAVVNNKHFSLSDVQRMHNEDGDVGDLFEADGAAAIADFLEQKSDEPALSGVLKRRAPNPSPGTHVSDGVARLLPRKARGEQGEASAQQRAAGTENPGPNDAGEQPRKAVGEQP
eukprot:1950894-Rhodomonas_salina.1